METNDLIAALSQDFRPVRRLRHPMVRALLWLALSIPYVALIVLIYKLAGFEAGLAIDARFVVEEVATIATAVTAAVAAFCCIVPGRDRRIGLLPLVPLAVWLAAVGGPCIGQLREYGLSAPGVDIGWECVPPSILIGLFPAIAMVYMLRRGAPLYPRSTILLGALAAAALANLGLRLFHPGDVTVVMLGWHLLVMALLFGAAGFFGPRLLPWRYRAIGAPFA